jgi:hypothetical protein
MIAVVMPIELNETEKETIHRIILTAFLDKSLIWVRSALMENLSVFFSLPCVV